MFMVLLYQNPTTSSCSILAIFILLHPEPTLSASAVWTIASISGWAAASPKVATVIQIITKMSTTTTQALRVLLHLLRLLVNTIRFVSCSSTRRTVACSISRSRIPPAALSFQTPSLSLETSL
ncbi:uncharacterized protein CLUP02_13127 [Colletotrichum lupini]|uniref:Uncharacterized protein n=1 Tax=Colletotrichum lupini TaxID=145971 RepID=A0A9Q8WLB5_9PEZI|nr:uncharacterized protein CLUP02_13127 [Colletotrichum lupini]KAK1703096.1 hypothetical protein BDP67DRAFT_536248 [Colletotrichum lupini]UQC87609.1 hypothetical protein CLUP02_13127 [Colletotrichum lupini]